MALKYLVDLNLTGNELQNAALQTLASDPTALAIGHIYFNTATNKVMVSTNGVTFDVVGNTYTADETSLTLSGLEFSIKDLGVSTAKIADLGVTTGKIANNAVTFAKLEDVAEDRIIGRISTGAGDAEELTAAQVRTIINVADGAEANVQSDWDATTGDALILNKPTLGTLAALNSVNAATITDNSVGAAELNVSGNGTTAQFLRSDGDGSFSWATPTDNDVNITNLNTRLAQVDPIIGTGAGTVVINGNLAVQGTTTTVDTVNLLVSDNLITLNADVTGTPTESAGIEVERGTSTNVSVNWNEAADRWEFTNDGVTYHDIPIPSEYSNNSGTVTSVTVAGGTGLSSSGSPITTAGTITLTNTDRGSSQFIFKNVASDSGTAVADNNNDTLTIAGGSQIDTSVSGDTLTVSHGNTSGLSGTYGSTANNTKIDQITVDANGHITAITTGATGDVDGVTAGAGLSGGGTSGTVTINNAYLTAAFDAGGFVGGTFTADLGTAGMVFDPASPVLIQVYEFIGAVKRLVLTDVSIDTNTGIASIELPAGDFWISASGLQA